MRTFRQACVIFTAALLSTAALACSDDSDTTGPGSVQGTYTLRSIDGNTLPYVFEEDEEFKAEILSGSITLGANGVCSASLSGRITDKLTGEVEPVSDGGPCTYAVSGSTLTLTFEDGEDETATLSGNTITVSDEDGTWIFRK